jgi:uncharacterized membrane protein YdjX (TVP38/TMEM64 family)
MQKNLVNRITVRSVALLALLVGVSMTVIYRVKVDPNAISNIVANSPWSPIVFIALQVAASLLFIPRTVMGIAAGLIFGLVWGAVWAIVGAIAGAAAGFALIRWMGAAGTLDASPGFGKLIEKAEQGGWRTVAIVRLIPGPPHSIANTLLALTNISWRNYLIGSFVGMLPMTLVQVDIGASGGLVFQGHSSGIKVCLLLALGLGASFIIKRAARLN